MKNEQINNFNENYAFLFTMEQEDKPKRKRIKAVYRKKVSELYEEMKRLEAIDKHLIYDTGEIPQTS